jgi:ElaB/YqjD/DUF883 family membrane-anchored ribosome-binding protein
VTELVAYLGFLLVWTTAMLGAAFTGHYYHRHPYRTILIAWVVGVIPFALILVFA